jgi:serine/threonine protein kinase/WD40 repeat protein
VIATKDSELWSSTCLGSASRGTASEARGLCPVFQESLVSVAMGNAALAAGAGAQTARFRDLQGFVTEEMPGYTPHVPLGAGSSDAGVHASLAAWRGSLSAEGSGQVFGRGALLSNGRLLKSVHCDTIEGGSVVVKMYTRRHTSGPAAIREAASLATARARIRVLRATLSPSKHPALLPYQRVQESKTRAVALLSRQRHYSTLSDRPAMRPSLTLSERLWLTFQLLKAVDQSHQTGVRHGDIKSENALLTSFGWLLLTDFALFKPPFLPVENPACFFTFFDPGMRARCYIAPERFVGGDGLRVRAASAAAESVRSKSRVREDAPAELRDAMRGRLTRPVSVACDPRLSESADVFSTGCVIAELWSPHQTPLFDYPRLLAFRKGELGLHDALESALPSDPLSCPPQVRSLCEAACARDAASRPTVSALLEAFTPSLFHVAFQRFLYPLVATCATHPSLAQPDAKVRTIASLYPTITRLCFGGDDPVGCRLIASAMHSESAEGGEAGMSVWASETGVAAAAIMATNIPDGVDGLSSEDMWFALALSPAHGPWFFEPNAFGVDPGVVLNSGSDEWLSEHGPLATHIRTERDHPHSRQGHSLWDSYGRWTPCEEWRSIQAPESAASEPELTKPAGRDASLAELLASARDAVAELRASLASTATATETLLPPEDDGPAVRTIEGGFHCPGMVVPILSLLTSSVRHVSTPRLRALALTIIGRLSLVSLDETGVAPNWRFSSQSGGLPSTRDTVLMDRVIPLAVQAVTDSSALIRAHAFGLLTSSADAVETVPATEAGTFAEFILPSVAKVIDHRGDVDGMLLAMISTAIPRLAISARRFADVLWTHPATETDILASSPGLTSHQSHAAVTSALQSRLMGLLQRLIAQHGGGPTSARSGGGSAKASFPVNEGVGLDATWRELSGRHLFASLSVLSSTLTFNPVVTDDVVLSMVVKQLTKPQSTSWETTAMALIASVGPAASSPSAALRVLVDALVRCARSANPLTAGRALDMMSSITRMGHVSPAMATSSRGAVATAILLTAHPSNWCRSASLRYLAHFCVSAGRLEASLALKTYIGPHPSLLRSPDALDALLGHLHSILPPQRPSLFSESCRTAWEASTRFASNFDAVLARRVTSYLSSALGSRPIPHDLLNRAVLLKIACLPRPSPVVLQVVIDTAILRSLGRAKRRATQAGVAHIARQELSRTYAETRGFASLGDVDRQSTIIGNVVGASLDQEETARRSALSAWEEEGLLLDVARSCLSAGLSRRAGATVAAAAVSAAEPAVATSAIGVDPVVLSGVKPLPYSAESLASLNLRVVRAPSQFYAAFHPPPPPRVSPVPLPVSEHVLSATSSAQHSASGHDASLIGQRALQRSGATPDAGAQGIVPPAWRTNTHQLLKRLLPNSRTVPRNTPEQALGRVECLSSVLSPGDVVPSFGDVGWSLTVARDAVESGRRARKLILAHGIKTVGTDDPKTANAPTGTDQHSSTARGGTEGPSSARPRADTAEGALPVHAAVSSAAPGVSLGWLGRRGLSSPGQSSTYIAGAADSVAQAAIEALHSTTPGKPKPSGFDAAAVTSAGSTTGEPMGGDEENGGAAFFYPSSSAAAEVDVSVFGFGDIPLTKADARSALALTAVFSKPNIRAGPLDDFLLAIVAPKGRSTSIPHVSATSSAMSTSITDAGVFQELLLQVARAMTSHRMSQWEERDGWLAATVSPSTRTVMTPPRLFPASSRKSVAPTANDGSILRLEWMNLNHVREMFLSPTFARMAETLGADPDVIQSHLVQRLRECGSFSGPYVVRVLPEQSMPYRPVTGGRVLETSPASRGLPNRRSPSVATAWFEQSAISAIIVGACDITRMTGPSEGAIVASRSGRAFASAFAWAISQKGSGAPAGVLGSVAGALTPSASLEELEETGHELAQWIAERHGPASFMPREHSVRSTIVTNTRSKSRSGVLGSWGLSLFAGSVARCSGLPTIATTRLSAAASGFVPRGLRSALGRAELAGAVIKALNDGKSMVTRVASSSSKGSASAAILASHVIAEMLLPGSTLASDMSSDEGVSEDVDWRRLESRMNVVIDRVGASPVMPLALGLVGLRIAAVRRAQESVGRVQSLAKAVNAALDGSLSDTVSLTLPATVISSVRNATQTLRRAASTGLAPAIAAAAGYPSLGPMPSVTLTEISRDREDRQRELAAVAASGRPRADGDSAAVAAAVSPEQQEPEMKLRDAVELRDVEAAARAAAETAAAGVPLDEGGIVAASASLDDGMWALDSSLDLASADLAVQASLRAQQAAERVTEITSRQLSRDDQSAATSLVSLGVAGGLAPLPDLDKRGSKQRKLNAELLRAQESISPQMGVTVNLAGGGLGTVTVPMTLFRSLAGPIKSGPLGLELGDEAIEDECLDWGRRRTLASLVRRLRALSVPPLLPDLGFLRSGERSPLAGAAVRSALRQTRERVEISSLLGGAGVAALEEEVSTVSGGGGFRVGSTVSSGRLWRLRVAAGVRVLLRSATVGGHRGRSDGRRTVREPSDVHSAESLADAYARELGAPVNAIEHALSAAVSRVMSRGVDTRRGSLFALFQSGLMGAYGDSDSDTDEDCGDDGPGGAGALWTPRAVEVDRGVRWCQRRSVRRALAALPVERRGATVRAPPVDVDTTADVPESLALGPPPPPAMSTSILGTPHPRVERSLPGERLLAMGEPSAAVRATGVSPASLMEASMARAVVPFGVALRASLGDGAAAVQLGDALVEAMKARRELLELAGVRDTVELTTEQVLDRAAYGSAFLETSEAVRDGAVPLPLSGSVAHETSTFVGGKRASRVPPRVLGFTPPPALPVPKGRPRGNLVSTLTPHPDGVTALITCQDHSWVASVGLDGFVRVYRGRQLMRGGTLEPALAYRYSMSPFLAPTTRSDEDGSTVLSGGVNDGHTGRHVGFTCGAAIDNASSMAVGTNTGEIHVLRIDVSVTSSRSIWTSAEAGEGEMWWSLTHGNDGAVSTPGVSGVGSDFERAPSSLEGDEARRVTLHRESSNGDSMGADGGLSRSWAPGPKGVSLIARLQVPRSRTSSGEDLSVVNVWSCSTDSASLLFAVTTGGTVAVWDVRRLHQPVGRGYAPSNLPAQCFADEEGAPPLIPGTRSPRNRTVTAPPHCSWSALVWTHILPRSLGTITVAEPCSWAMSGGFVFGTSLGAVGVFDSRFRRLVQLWVVPGGRAVTALSPYLSRSVVPSHRFDVHGASGGRGSVEKDDDEDDDVGGNDGRAAAAGGGRAVSPVDELSDETSDGEVEDGGRDTPSLARQDEPVGASGETLRPASDADIDATRPRGITRDFVVVRRLSAMIALAGTPPPAAPGASLIDDGIWAPGSCPVAFWCLETGACTRALATVAKGVGPPSASPTLLRVPLVAGHPDVSQSTAPGIQALSHLGCFEGLGGTTMRVASSAPDFGGAVRCILLPMPMTHLVAEEEPYAEDVGRDASVVGVASVSQLAHAEFEFDRRSKDEGTNTPASREERSHRRPIILSDVRGSGGGRERAYAAATQAALRALKLAAASQRYQPASLTVDQATRSMRDAPHSGTTFFGSRPKTSTSMRGVISSSHRHRDSLIQRTEEGGEDGGLVPASLQSASATERREQDVTARGSSKDRVLAAGVLVSLGPLVVTLQAAAEALQAANSALQAADDEAVTRVSGSTIIHPLEACALVRHELDCLSLPVWVITGSADRSIRCWDLAIPRQSHTISGPLAGQPRPKYGAALPPPAVGLGPTPFHEARLSMPVVHILCVEAIPPSFGKKTSTRGMAEEDSAVGVLASAALAADDQHSPTAASASRRHKGSTIIPPVPSELCGADPNASIAALQAVRNDLHSGGTGMLSVAATAHGGAISCMTWVDMPVRLLVSGSTDGSVRVWR